MLIFPFQLFLATLAADGIRPTVRDYERMNLALQTDGPWTIARFRDLLLSLLSRDQEQQAIFLRRFNTGNYPISVP